VEAQLADNEQGLVRLQGLRLHMAGLSEWPPMPALRASAAAAGRNIATDRSRHGSAAAEPDFDRPCPRGLAAATPGPQPGNAGSIPAGGTSRPSSRPAELIPRGSLRRRVARRSGGGEPPSRSAHAGARRPRREARATGVSPGRRGDGHPAGFGRRRSLVRLQPARSMHRCRMRSPVSPLVADARKPSATSRAS
jgi:hypothetical protein